jgi:hypothetical protein
MKLREFRKVVNQVEEVLLSEEPLGVCCTLRIVSHFGLSSNFCYWMAPRNMYNIPIAGVDGFFAFWLGLRSAENLPRRIDTLRLWEQICITEKLYLDF